MKFSFINYVFEIWTVAKIRDVDVGVAFDMFRTDIENGKALPFNTGKSLPNFDFESAKLEWNSLTVDEQKSAITEYLEFARRYYEELCEMFSALSE